MYAYTVHNVSQQDVFFSHDPDCFFQTGSVYEFTDGLAGNSLPYQSNEQSVLYSHFGVMDMCGFPKNLYYYYQSWWTDKDVLHISLHWNWQGKEGQPIDVWVNTNADNVELFLNGKSLGKKDMPRNSHLIISGYAFFKRIHNIESDGIFFDYSLVLN